MTSSNYLLTFFLVFEFKFNFTDKCFINNIINKVFDQFWFKLRLDNIFMNSSFKSGKFEHTNLSEFNESRIMVQIFSDLKD